MKITEDTASETRLYAVLAEEKLNASHFYEKKDISYHIREVNMMLNACIDSKQKSNIHVHLFYICIVMFNC